MGISRYFRCHWPKDIYIRKSYVSYILWCWYSSWEQISTIPYLKRKRNNTWKWNSDKNQKQCSCHVNQLHINMNFRMWTKKKNLDHTVNCAQNYQQTPLRSLSLKMAHECSALKFHYTKHKLKTTHNTTYVFIYVL